MKIWTSLTLSALLLSTLAAPVFAQTSAFPSKPITIVVPFPPGGVSDQLARGIGQKLAESLKTTVLVDNRPGGGAQIAANLVKNAPADGYTMFIGDIGAYALNPSLYGKLTYDPLKDFTPVARLVLAPSLLVVPQASPFKAAQDLISTLKAKSRDVTVASQSTGAGGHLFAEMLRSKTNGRITHVPYKGSAPALTDLVGGQVDLFFDPIITSGPFVKDARLRALAIGTDQRVPAFDNIPTLEEVGLGDINLIAWFGLAVKAGTPPEIVKQLSAESIKAIQQQELSSRFVSQGLQIAPMGSDEFRAFIVSESSRWARVIRQAGVRLD